MGLEKYFIYIILLTVPLGSIARAYKFSYCLLIHDGVSSLFRFPTLPELKDFQLTSSERNIPARQKIFYYTVIASIMRYKK
jgi:hypothetical protein